VSISIFRISKIEWVLNRMRLKLITYAYSWAWSALNWSARTKIISAIMTLKMFANTTVRKTLDCRSQNDLILRPMIVFIPRVRVGDRNKWVEGGTTKSTSQIYDKFIHAICNTCKLNTVNIITLFICRFSFHR